MWTTDFVRDGYVHFPKLLSGRSVMKAKTAIDRDLALHYEPARQIEYDNQSYCPGLRGAPEIKALYDNWRVQSKIGSLLDRRKLGFSEGQIALRRAHNTDRPYPPTAHIDGLKTAHNGVDDDELSPFTLLAGVFLSEVAVEFAGNFTVWPGSHLTIQRYFRERGPAARREGMPRVELGQPRQLLCSPGDVVLCHFSLAHAAAVNMSDNTRCAVFFRVWHESLDRHKSAQWKETGWRHLTDIWTDWRVSG